MSLPMRECGLKLAKAFTLILNLSSLPMRECGLKLNLGRDSARVRQSLPMRECGLKPLSVACLTIFGSHSPCGSVD